MYEMAGRSKVLLRRLKMLLLLLVMLLHVVRILEHLLWVHHVWIEVTKMHGVCGWEAM